MKVISLLKPPGYKLVCDCVYLFVLVTHSCTQGLLLALHSQESFVRLGGPDECLDQTQICHLQVKFPIHSSITLASTMTHFLTEFFLLLSFCMINSLLEFSANCMEINIKRNDCKHQKITFSLDHT